MVNTTPPRTSKTFEDYNAREDILPKSKFYGATYKIVDVVFDVYRKSTLKGEARMICGQGIRRKVTGTSKTPTNWRSFLGDDDNNTDASSAMTTISYWKLYIHAYTKKRIDPFTNISACPRCCNRMEQSSRYQS